MAAFSLALQFAPRSAVAILRRPAIHSFQARRRCVHDLLQPALACQECGADVIVVIDVVLLDQDPAVATEAASKKVGPSDVVLRSDGELEAGFAVFGRHVEQRSLNVWLGVEFGEQFGEKDCLPRNALCTAGEDAWSSFCRSETGQAEIRFCLSKVRPAFGDEQCLSVFEGAQEAMAWESQWMELSIQSFQLLGAMMLCSRAGLLAAWQSCLATLRVMVMPAIEMEVFEVGMSGTVMAVSDQLSRQSMAQVSV
jgi:hypothetical protein